jgi:hypothetical protein
MPEPNLSMFSPDFASRIRALTEQQRRRAAPRLDSPEATRAASEGKPTRLPPEVPGPTRVPSETPGPTRRPAETPGPTRLPSETPGPTRLP